MRSFVTTKRIVIGTIALAVLCVAAYVLSRPTKGTVEWHEREYRRLQEGNKLVGFIRWITGSDDIVIHSEAEETELAAHESALLQSGHLIEHIFLVSNRNPDQVLLALAPGINRIPLTEGVIFEITSTNGLRMLARSNDVAALPQLETLIRQADAPNNK